MASRISDSATQATRSLLSGGATASTAGLASSWAATEKANAPSASRSSTTESVWEQQSPRRHLASSSNASRVGSDRVEGFRSTQGISGGWPSVWEDDGRGSVEGAKGTDTWANQYRSEDADLSYTAQQPALFRQNFDPSSVTHAAGDDGAEVVALLNQPGSLFETDSLSHDIQTVDRDAEATAVDLFGEQDLEPAERDVARQLRESLPQPPAPSDERLFAPSAVQKPTSRPSSSHRQLHPNVELLHLPLSTSPTAVRRLSMGPDSSVAYFSSHSDREEWYRQWVEDWQQVLDSYQDEVWGVKGLDKLEQARQELQQVKAREGKGEQWWNDKASVRRLRLVLGHLGLGDAGVDDYISEEGSSQDEESMREAWSHSQQSGKGKGKSRLQESDEPQFLCPDCDGIYGTDEHLLKHQRHLEEQPRSQRGGAVEVELQKQAEALALGLPRLPEDLPP